MIKKQKRIKLTLIAALAAVTALVSAVGLSNLTPAARAAEDPSESTVGGTGPLKDEMTPELRARIKKGLDWLAKNLKNDGSMGGMYGGDSPAIMALAGIAFLADGDTPDEGPYGKEVSKILDFILAHCGETGLIAGTGDGAPMYGHGFATLFLAEAYGMTQRPDIKEKLQNAVQLIVHSQNPQGGWRYQPAPNDADISVTICQVMALRARNAGIDVPKHTIEHAIDYVRKSQDPDGGFSYTLGGGGSAFPRSAAGVACLYYAGIYSGDQAITKGTKYILQRLPGTAGNANGGNTAYGNYYAAQAMFMAGGENWAKFWPALRNTLMKQQQADGSFNADGQGIYGTAMSLIALEVPNRLLPILQK